MGKKKGMERRRINKIAGKSGGEGEGKEEEVDKRVEEGQWKEKRENMLKEARKMEAKGSTIGNKD